MVPAQAQESEPELVEKAMRGDRTAYGQLVIQYYPGIVHVVYRFCGDARLAEDMAQEAFLRAWIHLPSFHPHSSFRNWLYRIAINAALDTLRQRKEEWVDEESIVVPPDRSTSPELALIEKERVEALQKAMRSLPEAARSVLVLREYGGLSYREISGILDIPVGTVMSRLNYARNRLRQVIMAQPLELENEYA